ncbi:MAG TPA: LysR family transcriptional regulator [Polyangia bacterium]|jgi:DNA-binding transcriptional LysR family regulator|nr:LysR family transcriptional regulator [Polyangia bacterium]
MTVESLKTFCDLVETGSFSRAARLNFVTQSAVSQQLRGLERHFGVRLLDRGPRRSLQPTPAGKLVYAEARAAVERLAALGDRLRHRPDVVAGSVTVASVYSVGLHTLPGPMKSFLRAHPQVSLRLVYRRTDEVYRECLDGSADLGVVACPARRAQLEVVPLRPDELVLACPPDHGLARRARVVSARLSGERFIAFDRDIPTRRLVDRFLRAHGAAAAVTMELDNIETIKRSVEAGLGVSILPRPALENEVKAGTLVALPLAGGPLTRPLGLIHRRGRELSPAAQAFLETLRRDLGAP